MRGTADVPSPHPSIYACQVAQEENASRSKDKLHRMTTGLPISFIFPHFLTSAVHPVASNDELARDVYTIHLLLTYRSERHMPQSNDGRINYRAPSQ